MAGGKKAMSLSTAAVAPLLVVLLAVVVAPAAGFIICGVDADRMEAACGSYCKVGSRERAPRPECCAAVRHADFGCLCQYRGALRSVGNIDAGRAMTIPSKCHIRGVPTSC